MPKFQVTRKLSPMDQLSRTKKPKVEVVEAFDATVENGFWKLIDEKGGLVLAVPVSEVDEVRAVDP